MAASPASPKTPGPPTEGPGSNSRCPEDTAFKQQRLPAWQPTMSPPYVIACFLLVGCVFVPLGAAVIVASDSVQEVPLRYDHLQDCPFAFRNQPGYSCVAQNFSFQIQDTMKAPVYMFYELQNFYQNHRRYAKSRNDLQLAGEVITTSTGDCDPFTYPGQYSPLGPNTTVNFDPATPVEMSTVMYNPCGLIAWSMFNDSFAIAKEPAGGTGPATLICDGENFDAVGNRIDPTSSLGCEKKGIAWPSDTEVKYAQVPSDAAVQKSMLTHKGWPLSNVSSSASTPLSLYTVNGWYVNEVGHRIPNPVDEDLMVWMRLASLSTFRKLYRRITVDLQPGSYILSVKQRYDVRAFGGKKSFILSTSSWIGGKNYFLGGLYVATGSLCIVLGLAFLAKHITTPRRVASL